MTEKYSNNRSKLVQALPQNSTAVLITGNASLSRNSDTSYPFRQDSNVLYLSGISRPRIALLADIVMNRWLLVIPELSRVEKIFDDTDNWEATAKLAGLDGCVELRQAITILKERSYVGTIYHNEPTKNQLHGLYINPFRQYVHQRMRRNGLIAHDIKPYIANLRMIKQQYEIDAITQAVRTTLAVLDDYATKPNYLVDKSENEIANSITAQFYSKNVVHAYEPIVASGKNAAILHHCPDTETICKQGTGILFDVGAEYQGYAADISRTIVVGDSALLQKIVEDVKLVQQVLIQSIKPGGTWKQLHQLATKELENIAAKYPQFNKQSIQDLFPHAVGHFLGLDVHDAGDYAQSFQEGMVLTVEPGLYSKLNGVGVRIEDDIVVTKTGAKIIN